MFGDIDKMMGGMLGGKGGPGMMMHSQMGNGTGYMASSSFVMSSHQGSDGKMHTEQFAQSTTADGRGARETQQAYSNSKTGIDKMGLERVIDDRGRKMVKERNRFTQEEKTQQMFRGMDESQAGAFDNQWQQRASGMPRHVPIGMGSQNMRSALQGQGCGGMQQIAYDRQPQGRPQYSQSYHRHR